MFSWCSEVVTGLTNKSDFQHRKYFASIAIGYVCQFRYLYSWSTFSAQILCTYWLGLRGLMTFDTRSGGWGGRGGAGGGGSRRHLIYRRYGGRSMASSLALPHVLCSLCGIQGTVLLYGRHIYISCRLPINSILFLYPIILFKQL